MRSVSASEDRGRLRATVGLRVLGAATCLLVAGAAVGQSPEGQPPVGGTPEGESATDPVRAWLTAERPSEELRTAAAAAVLDEGAPALRRLERRLSEVGPAAAETAAERTHRQRLESLAVAVSLGFLERAIDSEMVYAGQYEPLRALAPYSGRLFLNLLLQTPDWFPDNRRLQLVPALRDLFPESPGSVPVARMRDLAADTRTESFALRLVLGYALAQWGDPELADRRLAELESEKERGRGSDRLDALRSIADFHYNMRDYRRAARAHRAFLEESADSDFGLVPADYYNAACCLNLAGDLPAAIEMMDRCFDLQTSPHVDQSVKLARKLFENDPEIAPLRATPRFQRQLEQAFGAADDGKAGEGGGKGVERT